jgi:hypothetical protein
MSSQRNETTLKATLSLDDLIEITEALLNFLNLLENEEGKNADIHKNYREHLENIILDLQEVIDARERERERECVCV